MIRARGAVIVVLAALALAACSKSETPKVDAKKEQAEAMERARHDVYGTQVQALDKAKALQADVNEKAAHRADDADAAK